MGSARAVSLSAAAAVVVACGTLGGGDDGGGESVTPDGGADSGCGDLTSDAKNCGACGKACGPAELCSASACVPGCPDHTVYVSTNGGNDSNPGCDRDHPKATIASAIGFLKTIARTADHEIHVCHGSYHDIDLTLDVPIPLRGGFECSSWKATTGYGLTGFDAATGRATGFDKINETRIEARGDAAALTITGDLVTRAVHVDGITFVGRSNGGAAIHVTNAASPTLENVDVAGGEEPAPAAVPATGSIGVLVDLSGAPDIGKSRIAGGGGTGTTTGSVGVWLSHSNTSLVHDSEIDGGHGTATAMYASTAAIGIWVSDGAALADTADGLARNSIFYAGTGIVQSTFAGIGILIDGASARATPTENRVIGGSLECIGPSRCVAAAIAVVNATTLTRIARNRVFAGAAGGNYPPELDAIHVSGTGTPVDVDDNVLHAGTGSGSAIGVRVVGSPISHVTNDTIYSTTYGVALDTAASTTSLTIENDLFAGASFAAIRSSSCSGARAVVISNAFVGTTTLLDDIVDSGGSCTDTTYGDLVSMESGSPAGSVNNVALIPTCSGGGPSCKKCSTPTACVTDAIAGFDPSLATVLRPSGYALAPGGWCRIAHGGAAVAPPIPPDLVGAVRSLPLSIGAYEQDAACTP